MPEGINLQSLGCCYFNFVVISCVDNNKTRELISTYLGWKKTELSYIFYYGDQSKSPAFLYGTDVFNSSIASMTWIDSGNETVSGQVICNYDTFVNGRGSNNPFPAVPWINSKVTTSPCTRSGVYGDGGALFSSMLDTQIEWEEINKFDFDNQTMTSSSFAYPIEWALIRSKEESVRLATDMYFRSLTMDGRPSIKMIQDMSGVKPGQEGYAEQIDFLVGYLASTNYLCLLRAFTPPITYHYPVVLTPTDKLNTELSCAERAQVDPQNLMVNAQASTYIMNYVSHILAPNPDKAVLESFGCVWNGSNCQELYFTKKNIENIFSTVYDNIQVGNAGKLMTHPNQPNPSGHPNLNRGEMQEIAAVRAELYPQVVKQYEINIPIPKRIGA